MRTRIRMHVVVVVAVLTVWVSFAAPARAQLIPLELETPEFAGLGVGVAPDYEGSNNYKAAVAPFFRYTFKGSERYVQLLANEATFNVLNLKNFRFGPSLTYQFGRSNVEDSVVKHMSEVSGTVMGGVFADYIIHFPDKISPERNRLIFGADFHQDLGSVNNGNRGGVSVRYWYPVAKPVDLYFGTRIDFASRNFMQTYFGVTPLDTIRSGLPTYNAGGGAKNYVLMTGATLYLSKSWLLAAGLRYSRLLDHASDSPIVDQRGSANQLIGGVGVGYMWGW